MHLEALLTAGAEVVGGVVYLNRKALGEFLPEGFTLTEAGKTHFKAEAAINAPAVEAPAKRGRKPKAESEVAGAELTDEGGAVEGDQNA